jgi:hypothetical protein
MLDPRARGGSDEAVTAECAEASCRTGRRDVAVCDTSQEANSRCDSLRDTSGDTTYCIHLPA